EPDLNFVPYERLPVAARWAIKLLGLLATALAVSLGAPFWFDLLNKLVSLRGAGKRISVSDAAAPSAKSSAGATSSVLSVNAAGAALPASMPGQPAGHRLCEGPG